MTNPVVSIIVPNYNHAQFLEERLQSIFNQTFQDFEVILLDDASTDKSVEILKKYASHRKVSHFIINKENSGSPFKQWEKGIGLAKGDFIWIAESDDYCENSFLKKIFNFIKESNKELDIVYSQSIDVNEKGQKLNNRKVWTSEFKPNIWNANFTISGTNFIKKYLKVKNVIPNASAVVFKRSLLRDQTFSEKLLKMTMCGDWYFWLRLCSYSSNLGFYSQPLNYFRSHSGISRNHMEKEKKEKRLIEESVIREYLFSFGNINQKYEIEFLYQRWFGLIIYFEIFKKKFYKVMLSNSSYFSFLKKYFLYKMHA